MKKYIVDYSPLKKSLKKIPNHVVNKLLYWAKSVESLGIEEVRKHPSYHDEPLKGERKGQRSIRLSKAYRVFYRESKNGEIHLILVEEVNKHEY